MTIALQPRNLMLHRVLIVTFRMPGSLAWIHGVHPCRLPSLDRMSTASEPNRP